MYDSIWILATHSHHKDSYAALQGCFHNTFLFPSTLNQTLNLTFVHWVISGKFNSVNVELLS